MDTRLTQRECGLRVRAFTSIEFCVKRWPFAASQVIASSLEFVYAERMCWTSRKMISWKNDDASTVGPWIYMWMHSRNQSGAREISVGSISLNFIATIAAIRREKWHTMCLRQIKARNSYDKCNARVALRNYPEWESVRMCMKKQQRRTWRFYLFIVTTPANDTIENNWKKKKLYA